MTHMPESDDYNADDYNPEIAACMFSFFAEHVHQYGKPYRGGQWLRESLHTAQIVCEKCGQLPLDLPDTDWLTLCADAREHVQETGHRVVVRAVQESIYGPPEESEERKS